MEKSNGLCPPSPSLVICVSAVRFDILAEKVLQLRQDRFAQLMGVN